MKSFSFHLPFGTKDAYAKEITAADLNKLASARSIDWFFCSTFSTFFLSQFLVLRKSYSRTESNWLEW
jgi:hypothetical protein